MQFLGDEETVKKAMEAVTNQGKAVSNSKDEKGQSDTDVMKQEVEMKTE